MKNKGFELSFEDRDMFEKKVSINTNMKVTIYQSHLENYKASNRPRLHQNKTRESDGTIWGQTADASNPKQGWTYFSNRWRT